MLKTNVYDMSGKLVGEIELSEAVFGIEANESVVHDVVKNHLANCRQGTQSALSAKAAAEAIIVIDEIKMDAPKTAAFAKFLKAVGAEGKSLVVTAAADQNVVKSGRNIPGCEVTFANLINVYDVINANKLVVDKAALAKIEEVFA